jgi:methionyl-tRNA synthetase
MNKPKQSPYTITTAIYYANARLHIGHCWELLGSDMMARFRSLEGREVLFSTGMDEHSINVEKAAAQANKTPKAYCDEIASDVRKLLKILRITNTRFIRTSDSEHERSAQDLIQRAKQNGDIYKAIYEGMYCNSCEAFYTEKDLIQESGQWLCPNHKTKVENIKEENWFFRLSNYQEALLKLYRDRPEFIQPESRRNEIIRFVESGLRDFSVSRSHMNWGIPLPWDEQQMIYVWFDALTNYLSVTGFSDDPELFKKFWPADVHVIGKDITRFHAVYWPAMLMSAGIELPKQVFAHGWLHFKGEKMSKSRGHIVGAEEMVEAYGLDPVRWYVLANNDFHGDGNFSEEKLVETCNAELSNDLGNLINRTLNMLSKYQDGKTGPLDPIDSESGSKDAVAQFAREFSERMKKYMDHWDLLSYGKECIRFSTLLNKYIDDFKPWKLAKEEGQKETLSKVLSHVHEGLRMITIALKPILTEAPEKIWEQLGYESFNEIQWQDIEWGKGSKGLKGGVQTKKPRPVFPRLEFKEDENDKEKAETQYGSLALKSSKDEVDFKAFTQLELKVGTIEEVQEVEKSAKLLKLKVNFGEGGPRTVVSGLRKAYPDAQELKGRQVAAVLNLKPRKIFGIESQAMILTVGDEKRKNLKVLESPEGFLDGSEIS